MIFLPWSTDIGDSSPCIHVLTCLLVHFTPAPLITQLRQFRCPWGWWELCCLSLLTCMHACIHTYIQTMTGSTRTVFIFYSHTSKQTALLVATGNSYLFTVSWRVGEQRRAQQDFKCRGKVCNQRWPVGKESLCHFFSWQYWHFTCCMDAITRYLGSHSTGFVKS